ncbi:nucleoprotein TPR [Lucilia sericata]|uniref:nucleoprotein TPR n=1 Tax=Lucilia sericata TaxID=13632 RepID=UPI0018A82043|nr:nucleoprotein TPR [Lucilia sericata]XP_037819608.1 nucleoprotein TPR [Lucilia sericata]
MERFAIKIDKKLKANLYKICRLCGIDNPDMVPILTDKPENAAIDVEAEMEMAEKINLLLGLSVTKDDKMPQSMCYLCVDKINDFYEFREMCYSTNAQTRKLLGLKNVKKPPVDIKPKVEIKEESIVPTNNTANTPAANNKANRKRKTEEVALKEEIPATPVVLPKKKLRFSAVAETSIKEEVPVITKKKLRFTVTNDEATPTAAVGNKKTKNAFIEESKLKKEPSPPVSATTAAVSSKKLKMSAPTPKEIAAKKSKQKPGKTAELDVKEEIKEEIKEEPLPAAAPAPAAKVPPASKLKFGCNICKERFAAKINLDAHTRTTHIPKIERFVCTACNEVLSKSFDIKNHQLWHKLSKTPYVCGCCGESILNTYAFSRHLREHAFETPPALLVLDRECPQCHTSYATNYLYNIHICAVKTKRCAGCNRLQRNDAEYIKHSAQCAKVYLNYSKHIMPSVEALEDAVRIKNENDVEAAAEEMARLSGVPLDMAPVVQLTRLSSPIIMAANQCVSMTGLDDAASTSSKRSGKKGVSKKDLKRVDELLKSTLDALVSIKHEPEVHVEPETPCAGVHSDNDEHNESHVGGLDDYHHNDDDSDYENEPANTAAGNIAPNSETNVANEITSVEQIKIKQEIDEINEDNANKIGGGGLKLKIKKEHGQLNSSIIEQQKSSEKRAEKRKKKKKHKDKEKEKQKLSKDLQDEQMSQDSNGHNNAEENMAAATTIRIKTEPQDGTDAADMQSVASTIQIRPQPEATIMTSIPMMQFQIACVSSGVEFNGGAASAVAETPQTMASTNHEAEPEDVKPNREELDRMMKISHVSSGIAMETDDNEEQPMDHDGNDDEGNGGDVDEGEETDYHEESNEDDHHDDDNESAQDHVDEEQEAEEEAEDEHDKDIDKTSEDTGIDNEDIIAKKIKKPLLKPKTKLALKSKVKSTPSLTKSRNKACKSTAKPSNMPVLQITAVRSGVTLEPTAPCDSDFIPIFIKPEPQNRGYSDEQPLVETPRQTETVQPQEETDELSNTHTAEEQNYISSIDFNNITIKQEKDIEINDVQISQKSVKSYADFNGIKRKRKAQRRTHGIKDRTLKKDEKLANTDENMEAEEEHETDEEVEEEIDDEEEAEEVEEEEEDDEEEADEEEEEEEVETDFEEEREYRELEYPPALEKEAAKETEDPKSKPVLENQMDISVKENIADSIQVKESNMSQPSFVIASVCSQVAIGSSEDLHKFTGGMDNMEHTQDLNNHNDKLLKEASVSEANELISQTEDDPNKSQTLQANQDLENVRAENPHLSAVVGASENSDIAMETPSIGISNVPVTFNGPQTENTQLLPATLPLTAQQENIQASEMSLQLGQPFELGVDQEINQTLNTSQVSNISDSDTQLTQNSGPLRQDQLSMSLGNPITQDLHQHPQQLQCAERNSQENIELPTNSQENPPHTLQGSSHEAQIPQEYTRTDSQDNTAQDQQQQQQLPQPHTSQDLQPVFKISSITSAAIDVTPQFSNNPSSNSNDDEEILKDNQEETAATIEGVVEQAKELNLEAQPVTEEMEVDNENEEDDEEEEDDVNEDENELNDGDNVNNDDSSTLCNNLEERQNYQNQEVLTQFRPAALALHPYLEDISSSSNSLLSNSLSQTPPPTATSLSISSGTTAASASAERRLLNTEETENILNESSDALSRRSSVVAATAAAVTAGQPVPPSHLVQQLPPHMPTFNFDNINEIAENNNNANIEREQLQDGQHHQQQHQQQTRNNQ